MGILQTFCCDAVHPDRTPPACRGFMTVPPGRGDAVTYARRRGWTFTGSGRALCPSCTGKALRAVTRAVGWA